MDEITTSQQPQLQIVDDKQYHRQLALQAAATIINATIDDLLTNADKIEKWLNQNEMK